MALPMAEFGGLITAKRGPMGVRAAAAEAGISPATLSRVENGHMPDLETFAKICKWLGRDPREFLGIEGRDAASARRTVVHFKKNKTVVMDTATALGELIRAAEDALSGSPNS
jgi:transcriptional regulator with XRE-family HTH domain